ncbi:hypothetical protein MCETE7_01509 [Acidimicrobiia bacterium]
MLAGNVQPLKQFDEVGIVAFVEHDETGIDGDRNRISECIRHSHVDGVGMSPRSVIVFENGDIVMGIK